MSPAQPKPPAGHILLLYFATASSYTRKTYDFIPIPTEGSVKLTVPKLFNILEEKYPEIKAKVLTSCAVTVDLDYVDFDLESPEDDAANQTVIEAGSEVAIIPPVSSG